MEASGYRADIDGLRGIAVSAVVLFHCHWGLSGGYVGVDVFFVISGFLITRLIVAAQRRGDFSLREFWMRRVRRLAPAVIAMVLCTMAAGAWLMYPRDLYYFAKSSLAQVLLASNIHFYNYLDYFAGPAELQPLLHTWSLAVEEQFYLVFPLIMVATQGLSARWRRRSLLLIAVASLGYSILLVPERPSAAFFLLPPRAWELMVGAALVFLPAGQGRTICVATSGESDESDESKGAHHGRWAWMWEAASMLGLAGVVAPCFLYDSNTAFPGATAVAPCLATALIIYANGRHSTLVARVLSTKWLVGIGLISYSLYLWHWPILSYLRYIYGEGLPASVTVAALIASFGCGYASWRFIETPFRRRQVVQLDSMLVRGAIACSLLIAVGSGASLATRGLPGRWGSSIADALASSSNTMQRFRTGKAAIVRRDELPTIGAPKAPKGAETKAERPRILVWGDSHAAALGQLCDELATEHGIRGYVASRGGTAPLLDTWRIKSRTKVVPWNRSVVEFVRRKQIAHVLLVCRWSGNVAVRDNGLTDALIADQQSTAVSPAEAKLALRRGLHRTVNALVEAGAKVWLMRQVPHQDQNPFRLVINAGPGAHVVTGVSRAAHDARQRDVDEVFADVLADFPSQRVALLDPGHHCFDALGRSLVGTPQLSYYSDPSHLSTEGSRRLLTTMLDPVFASIAHSVGMTEGEGGGPPTVAMNEERLPNREPSKEALR